MSERVIPAPRHAHSCYGSPRQSVTVTPLYIYMERLRRSFTFSGRKRRQSEEEQKKSRASPKNEASGSRKNDENGTENPDAGFRPRSGSDRLHKAEVRM